MGYIRKKLIYFHPLLYNNSGLFIVKVLCSNYLNKFSNSVHDDYHILDRIGSGNYSTVFKGISKKSKTDVAIKVI